MDEENKVSLEEFRDALTPKNVKTVQVINLAIGMGVFAFFLVVVFFHSQAQGTVEENLGDVSFMQILSLVHLVFAVVAFTSALIVYEAMLKIARNTTQAGTAEGCFGIIRTAGIVRLALMEGAAFFGLVVCMLCAMDNILTEYPIYWLNALSSVVMIAFVGATFPTRDGLERTFQNKFLSRM